MRERLSALMDDQGDHVECEHCLDQVRGDVELRETWQVYHLIGDVLRGTHGGALPTSFSERLAAEPTVLAPRTAPRRPRGSLVRYALPIAASVAAVTFVAWVGLPQLQTSTVLQADAGTGRVAPIPVATAPVVATPAAAPVAAMPVAATPVPLARDVGDYLLAHQRYSPSSAMSGVAPYVRTVSESGPTR